MKTEEHHSVADERLVRKALDSLPDLSLNLPQSLRRTFDTLILATADTHADEALGKEGTLVIAYDWLLWRRLREDGIPCIHFETAFAEAPLDDPEVSDVFLRANDWVFDDMGRDVTVFRGVSLGKLFVKELSYLWFFYRYHLCALNWFCKTFSPTTIIAHNFRSEFLRPSVSVLRSILEEVADAREIKLIDLLDAESSAGDDQAFKPIYDVFVYKESHLRTLLRTALTTLLETVSKFISLFSHDRLPMVLLHTTGAMGSGLIKGFDSKIVQPLLVADQVPKNPKNLADLFRRGMALGARRRGRLSGRDRCDVRDVAAAMRERLNEGVITGYGRVLMLYAEQKMFASGRIWDYALDVKQTDNMFRRHPRIKRVVIDGLAGHRIFMELARRYGIGVDFLPHGLYFTAYRHEPLCGDRFTAPGIDRILTWGPQIEDWLDVMGSKVRTVRIGHPGYQNFTRPAPASINADTKVLILPCVWNLSDCEAPSANNYTNLIQTIKLLEVRGVRRIKVKLHPGLKNAEQYRAIIERYNLGVELHQRAPLSKFVAWADVVIGTAWSSSVLKAIANGTPYVPLIPERSRSNPRLLGTLRVARILTDLAREMESGMEQDWDELMDAFFSHPAIEDAAQCFWNAMAKVDTEKGRE